MYHHRKLFLRISNVYEQFNDFSVPVWLFVYCIIFAKWKTNKKQNFHAEEKPYRSYFTNFGQFLQIFHIFRLIKIHHLVEYKKISRPKNLHKISGVNIPPTNCSYMVTYQGHQCNNKIAKMYTHNPL